ncbi:putative PRC-barrel-like superfamily protein [Helianthus annuus]|nr:putative PRC-barrel-like superfamily protein [Helianthus annuus]KAJ0471440.1 putative PRC-barrel-like superfamily protein [Helianthus annuus]
MCDCPSSSSLSSSSCIKFPPSSIHILSLPPSFHYTTQNPPKFSTKTSQNPNPRTSKSNHNQQFLNQLNFKEQKTTKSHLELNRNDEQETEFLQFDGDLMNNEGDEEDLVEIVDLEDDLDVKLGELDEVKVVRKGKQLVKRCNVVAKQVISIQSAVSLGFVSQLWVDTNTWMVVIVEVRPNLLSGQQEMFFLEDTKQVGDVVLVEDETVMDKEFKLVGLETLVGYSVVTPGRRDIGKVRGYTFNINSGAIESLELDSFGISIIPSSLVSTYSLLVEDVLEVVSDTVVVHDAAASRIQRLTKGFWDAKRTDYSMDDFDYYSDLEERSEYRKGRRRRPGPGNLRPREKPIDNTQEEWDLPMDYL